jgi:CRISPR-associated protein Csm1
LDLSGIQSFLYNIGGQGAAASLKGRSFFLHLAMDALVRSILEKFHLSSAQVLYSGGGKAFLLLPNEEAGTKKLSKLVEHANTSAFKNHQGQLQFHFGAVAFRIAQFGSLELEGVQSPVPYSQLWGAAVQNASANKGRKLAHLIQQQPSLLFGDDFNGLDIDDNHAFCRVTGRTLLKGEAIAKLQKEDYSGDKPLVTREVKDMIDLGKALRNVRYIGIRKLLGDGTVSTTKVPFELGFYYEPLEEAPAPEDGFDTVIHFNESETPLGPFVPEWMPLGGTEMVWEQSENRQKTLKELCKGSYLGGLRMDVDNLGRLFSQTTNDLGNSLFGLTTVSASINWFFSAHINALRRNEPFKDRVNVIYAGGDDLFMVGEWEAVLQFGKAIRNAFQTFLGGTTMTLSGGLAISGDKYPLRLLALDSGDAEDHAKAFCLAGSNENNDPTKNAIGIFNGAFSWDQEWPEVETLSREMLQLISDGDLPRGFLHRAIDWKRNKDEYLKVQATTAPRFMWDLAYLLGRNEQGPGREWGVQLRKNIALGHVFTPHLHPIQVRYRYLDLLATGARLTELITKQKQSYEKNRSPMG